jgi:Uma2 family endonuclease
MPTAVKTETKLEEYCLIERDSPTRHQYINGEITPVPYTSEKHSLIIGSWVKNRRGCRLYIADRMLYVPKEEANGNVYYPDLMIVEGEPVFKEISTNTQATTNPSVLIEVLSDSNSDNDLVEKLTHYKSIPTLKQCLIFWQTKRQVESFTRISEKEWLDVTLTEKDGSVQVLGCPVSFADVYDKVD